MALAHYGSALLQWMGWYIVPFVAVLSLIVFVHELGHYLVGRWSGVKIDAFSLGFGPELFARVDKHGTRWRVALLPLGGYVRFYGDSNPSSAAESFEGGPVIDRALTLAGQPLRNRAAIVAAGPIANFLLALAMFTGLFMALGRVEHAARVGGVEPQSAAASAGFQVGDLVKSIDGSGISSFEQLMQAAALSTGIPMHFVVERDGAEVALDATPQIAVVDRGVLGKMRMGHLGLAATGAPGDVKYERCGAPTCLFWGAQEVVYIVKATGSYIIGMFAGRETPDQMSGAIGVAQMAGEMAKISLWELLNLAALFSVSVGFMNLLPVPLLDGGHLVFYAYEAIRGRPLNGRIQDYSFKVGIALVALLVVFTTTHDILRLVISAN